MLLTCLQNLSLSVNVNVLGDVNLSRDVMAASDRYIFIFVPHVFVCIVKKPHHGNYCLADNMTIRFPARHLGVVILQKKHFCVLLREATGTRTNEDQEEDRFKAADPWSASMINSSLHRRLSLQWMRALALPASFLSLICQ